MAVDIKHKFVSAVPDSGDPTIVQSTDWNDGHDLTLGGEKLLGRYSAGNGVAQEISLGGGLEFSGSELRTNVTKGDVGLGNVDNTSDTDKPISTAQQTALNGKADTDLSNVTQADARAKVGTGTMAYRNFSFGAGDPSGGADGDIYFKVT